MFKTFTLMLLLISTINSKAQISLEGLFTPPSQIADTLYFPFEDSVQLIVINSFDTWKNMVDFKEATAPRGLTWASVLGPAPKNIYLFRNKAGDIIKAYNGMANTSDLKNTDFVNANFNSIPMIPDYYEYHKHLKFYDLNDQVGLINVKGDIVVPAVYDNIRKYWDHEEKWDKLVIEKDGYFGLMDSNVNVLFPPIYKSTLDPRDYSYPEHHFINGQYIKVYKNEKCGVIDENGVVKIDFKFDNLMVIHDSLIVGMVNKAVVDFNKYFWLNVQGCVVFDKNFDQIANLDQYDQVEYNGIKRFIVKKDNLFGVVDHKGEIIIPLEYDNISLQNSDYYVFKSEKSGMISLGGKLLIPIEYERNMYFYGQAIYVIQNGLIGVYSNKYELVAAPQFKLRYWEMGKFMLSRPDGSIGFVVHQKEGSYYQSPEGEITEL